MTNPELPQSQPVNPFPPQPGIEPLQGAPNHSAPPSGRTRRRVIPATCAIHRGAIGFTNLVVSARGGMIVIDPHADGSCVIYLDEDSARTLCATVTEWLG